MTATVPAPETPTIIGAEMPFRPLRELLSRSTDWITLDPAETYTEVTVRLWGKGVVARGEKAGSDIGGTRRLRVHPREFLLSRIDARNGAFGIVPTELDGAVVSNDFPCFRVDESVLLPEYLGWLSWTRWFVEACKQVSEGTTNRVRLNEERFLAIRIPAPAVDEQRRIVAKIEDIAARIDEAEGLRHRSHGKCHALLSGAIQEVMEDGVRPEDWHSFGAYEPHVTSGPRSWSRYYSQHGHRFYRAQDIGADFTVLSGSKQFLTPPAGSQGRTAFLEAGDLMIVITGATVGRAAVFDESLEPGFVSQHVAICRLPQSQINPQYALWHLRGRTGQEQLLGQRYGQGKPGLNLTNLRNLSLPYRPLEEQRRVVTYLNHLQTKVDCLKGLQQKTAAELDALLPSILDKAFKGEL